MVSRTFLVNPRREKHDLEKEPRGLADTQEVLEFCATHAIGPEIQLIDIDEVNDAYDKVEKGDVRFRYVIDMASLKSID